MATWQEKIESELKGNILGFWQKYCIDETYGGFKGQISNSLEVDPKADKGLILNARILWTFAKSYEKYREESLLATARRSYEYIVEHFVDKANGGVYWMLDYQGIAKDSSKYIYGQAFTIYALAEYYRACADVAALELARQLFLLVEKHSYDSVNKGYGEVYDADWRLSSNQQLSEVDMVAARSMNTHLHVMEAYATLLSVYEDTQLRARVCELIECFLDKIVNPINHHMYMFFDAGWKPQSENISFGHDIEASWLLVEAAEILGDEPLIARVKVESVKMASAVLAEAVDPDGGVVYEANAQGIIEDYKDWWPQAEALVGFLNAYQISNDPKFLIATKNSWEFIDQYIVDHDNGEWFWQRSRDLKVNEKKYKVDPWKCPYHNGRACLEAIARLSSL